MIDRTIADRRSIREYSSEDVTDQQIREILEAGMYAPSAKNTRPWKFIVTRSQEKRDAIKAACPNARMIDSSPVAIVMVGLPELSDYWQQDCGASIQNILLQCTSMGLGSCWCGVYPKEDRVAAIKRIFSITEGEPVAAIAIGHPMEDPERRGFYEDSKVQFV